MEDMKFYMIDFADTITWKLIPFPGYVFPLYWFKTNIYQNTLLPLANMNEFDKFQNGDL